MSEEPWYKEGLRFQCAECGGCCTGDPGVVWVSDDEIQQIAQFTGKSIGEIRLFHTRLVGNQVSLTEYANGDCTFFDARQRKCAIYPVRPPQCRSWPFWRSNVASPESWAQAESQCPGAGNGGLVACEEIQRLTGDERL